MKHAAQHRWPERVNLRHPTGEPTRDTRPETGAREESQRLNDAALARTCMPHMPYLTLHCTTPDNTVGTTGGPCPHHCLLPGFRDSGCS